jgi:hypothetical protein
MEKQPLQDGSYITVGEEDQSPRRNRDNKNEEEEEEEEKKKSKSNFISL